MGKMDLRVCTKKAPARCGSLYPRKRTSSHFVGVRHDLGASLAGGSSIVLGDFEEVSYHDGAGMT